MAETGKAITATTRYWDVLDTVHAVVDPPLPRALAQPVPGALRLEAVHFRYPGAATEVLRALQPFFAVWMQTQ